jgi:hypothetical protein
VLLPLLFLDFKGLCSIITLAAAAAAQCTATQKSTVTSYCFVPAAASREHCRKMPPRSKLLRDAKAMLNLVRQLIKKSPPLSKSIPALIVLGWLLAWIRGISKAEVRRMRTTRNERIIAALQTFLSRKYTPSVFTPNAHLNSGLGYVKAAPRLTKTRELVRTWGEFHYTQSFMQCANSINYQNNMID